MIARILLAALLFLVWVSAPSAQLSMMDIGPGGMGGVAAPCVPGASNGAMDFSVCSNVGITAALW